MTPILPGATIGMLGGGQLGRYALIAARTMGYRTAVLDPDPHAPAKFRAIAAPSNMPAFAEAFQCKSGDEMVRGGDAQVKIW